MRCREGAGFDNCETFQNRAIRNPTGPGLWAPPGSCPRHDLKGEYDFNTTRIISKVTYGVKLGGTPQRGKSGLDLMCCVMM